MPSGLHSACSHRRHSFFRASLGLAGFSATLVFQVRRAVSRRASSDAGVEAWRLLPIEIPSNMDAILRNRFNDVVYEELDDIDLSPFRTLAVIRLPVDKVPQVGQVQQLVLRHGSVAHLAMKFAAEKHGGFLGIAVDVVQAKYLPRGCVGAEVLKLSCEEDEDSVYVTLRGVSMLRILVILRTSGGFLSLWPFFFDPFCLFPGVLRVAFSKESLIASPCQTRTALLGLWCRRS